MIVKLSTDDCVRLSSWWMAQAAGICLIIQIGFGLAGFSPFWIIADFLFGIGLTVLFVAGFVGLMFFFKLRRGLLDNREDYERLFPRFSGLTWIRPIIIAASASAISGLLSLPVAPWRWFGAAFALFAAAFYVSAFRRGLRAETLPPPRQPRLPGQPQATGEDARRLQLEWRLASLMGERFAGGPLSISMNVSRSRHEMFLQKNLRLLQQIDPAHPSSSLDWGKSHVEGGECVEATILAQELHLLTQRYGLCELQQIELFLSAVQAIPLPADNEASPHPGLPRFPIQTLFEEKGAPDDKAILLAALLRECGFETALLHCEGLACGSIVCGVRLEESFPELENLQGYLYCETSSGDGRIGAKPPEVRLAAITPVSGLVPQQAT